MRSWTSPLPAKPQWQRSRCSDGQGAGHCDRFQPFNEENRENEENNVNKGATWRARPNGCYI